MLAAEGQTEVTAAPPFKTLSLGLLTGAFDLRRGRWRAARRRGGSSCQLVGAALMTIYCLGAAREALQ